LNAEKQRAKLARDKRREDKRTDSVDQRGAQTQRQKSKRVWTREEHRYKNKRRRQDRRAGEKREIQTKKNKQGKTDNELQQRRAEKITGLPNEQSEGMPYKQGEKLQIAYTCQHLDAGRNTSIDESIGR
jgi:hypothetical protein